MRKDGSVWFPHFFGAPVTWFCGCMRTQLVLFVLPQVVSFGPLGILGRVGWFCREADVELWHSLAGYRGLKDPAVVRHFNGTFFSFERDWGDINT